MVLNKPAGLAVQGGSGTTRHVDQMLEVMRDAKGQKPRLVHRLDKETAGCLLVAKTRFAATALTGSFRHRSARKIYWALVAGVPKPKQGRISTFLAKDESEEDSIMRIAAHGDEGASHAVTYYAVVETSAQKLAWVSLKPVTGRTINCARTWRISITRSSAIPNISTRKIGNCPEACRSGCICWRAESSYRILAAGLSTPPRRCRRICCNHGTCWVWKPTGSIRSRTRLKNNLPCGFGAGSRHLRHETSIDLDPHLCGYIGACRRECRVGANPRTGRLTI